MITDNDRRYRNATGDPHLVNNAAKVMQLMIENFANPILFGKSNLEFFTIVTASSLGSKDQSEVYQTDYTAASRRLVPS
mgnify:CR=1 FL=1